MYILFQVLRFTWVARGGLESRPTLFNYALWNSAVESGDSVLTLVSWARFVGWLSLLGLDIGLLKDEYRVLQPTWFGGKVTTGA